MRAALVQIRDIAQSESEEEQTADIAAAASGPLHQLSEAASSVSSTSSGALRDA